MLQERGFRMRGKASQNLMREWELSSWDPAPSFSHYHQDRGRESKKIAEMFS